MKKIVGLCLVMLISSVSIFAQTSQNNTNGAVKEKGQRSERIASELKLNDKQAAEFKKIQEDFQAKAKAQKDAANADRQQMREKMLTLRNEKNAEIKKILSEEQYQQYQKFEQRKHNKHDKAGKRDRNKNKNRNNGKCCNQ